MKKVFFCVACVCTVAGLFVALYSFNERFFPGNNDYRINNEYMYDSPQTASPSETVSENTGTGKFVEPSSVSGYLMLAEGDDVNIYEVYSNGYREKIAGLGTNPLHMRKVDYKILTEGIFVDSYEEMCNLMEDYSS